VKLIQEQGLGIEAVHFIDVFSTSDVDEVRALAKRLRIRLHVVPKGDDFFDIVRKPKHGYGRNMNPCIDCRIHILKKAWELASKQKAHLLVTGDVLNERPMSQKKGVMELIDKEAGVSGHVLRPLSGKLLPPTEAEKHGVIDRNKLLSIRGRSRKKQIALARRYRIKKYPTPAGGCLLTDPEFSRKLRNLIKHNKLNHESATLLRFGRHFRCGKHKIIVGRNEEENKVLINLAKEYGLIWMEVKDHKGPVTIITGGGDKELMLATGLTVRYSDAPKNKEVGLVYRKGKEKKKITARAMHEKDIKKLRI